MNTEKKRMKALFLIFHGFNEANGISKKIRYQVKALKECGVDVRLCHYDVTPYGERRWMVNDEVIADFGTGFAAKVWRRVYYSPIIDYARREGIDFVYMRSGVYHPFFKISPCHRPLFPQETRKKSG